jgi:hypothetical protein
MGEKEQEEIISWRCVNVTVVMNIRVPKYKEHTQKNGAVCFYSLLIPHHSFVYALYIEGKKY